MRYILLALCSVHAFILSGCMSSWQYVKAPNQELKVVDTSKARIYVIRPDSGSKMASTRISDNGVLIGNTGPRGYICWEREPGKVKVASISADETSTELTVAAGSVYYVVQRVDGGLVYGKSSLTIVSEEAGLELLKACKPAYFTKRESLAAPGQTQIEAFMSGGTGLSIGGGAVGSGSAGGFVFTSGGVGR